MKKLILLVTVMLFSLPISYAKADDSFGSLLGGYLEDREKRHKARDSRSNNSASPLTWESPKSYSDIKQPEYDYQYKAVKPLDLKETKPNRDDRYIKLKSKKSSVQLDTWGRNGGQHKTSEEVLRHMMSPAN